MNPHSQFATRAAHAGKMSVSDATRPVSMPIYRASVYAFADLDLVEAVQSGRDGAYLYARNRQPNAEALAQAYAALEGGEAGATSATGMGVIFAVLHTLLEPGAHVVATHHLYGGTYALLERELARYGITTSYVDTNDIDALERAITPSTRLVFVESLTNPTVQVADLSAISALCRRCALKLVVDNTFATPFVMQPLAHGADVVVSSATKFLGGHSDLMAGVAAGERSLISAIERALTLNGAMIDPFAAWLTVRGIKTLHLRMQRQSENALALARFLLTHQMVEQVYYPGLQPHPLLAHGAGAMLSFNIRGGRDEANRLIRAFQMVEMVPSLGDVTTTVSYPALTSHIAMSREQREALGIGENMIRVSTGCESAVDIIADFAQALEQLRG